MASSLLRSWITHTLTARALASTTIVWPADDAAAGIVAAQPLRFAAVDLGELQHLMARTYGQRDTERGLPATVAWLAEEVGELAQAVRKGTPEQQRAELADVLAWVASLANQLGIDLDDAVARYADGCPKCHGTPCGC